jgi:glutathione gamma-glutamylcysteinyltransferase
MNACTLARVDMMPPDEQTALAALPSSPERAASLYRRPLPGGQIAFSSTEGRRLFREALAAGHMEGWFALSEQFHTQSDPAFCGLGTLVVVLNALEIDPGRIWKGPWRWYGEDLLDCCQPLEKVRQHGVTLDELACLARCNGATATTVRAALERGATAEALREAIRATTAAARGPVLVASYARSALGQTGSGHFSPVAGYHPGRDLALILDVARFKYPPHWVAVSELWRAMTELDPATASPRGWIILDRGRQRAMPLVFRLSAGDGLSELVASLLEETPTLLSGIDAATPEELVTEWVRAVDGRLGDRIRRALEPIGLPAVLPEEHRHLVEAFLMQLATTRVHQAVRRARSGTSLPSFSSEILAVLLLALPPETVARLPVRVATLLAVLRDPAGIGPAVADEMEALRDQLTVLRQWSCNRPSITSTSTSTSTSPDPT